MESPTLIGGSTHTCEVTPVVSSGVAYTAGDQVGGLITLAGAAGNIYRTATLLDVVVIDKSKQNAALTVILFDELPTVVSADNDPIDVSDAEMADKAKATFPLAAADYTSLANNSIADRGLAYARAITSRSQNGNLYALITTSGTPTYTSTSDLVLSFTFAQDMSDAR